MIRQWKRTATNHYRLCQASGILVDMVCPNVFVPDDVAKRLPHTLVFLRVPSGRSLYVDTTGVGEPKVTGPAWVYVTPHDRMYRCPYEPTTDREAFAIHQMFCPHG